VGEGLVEKRLSTRARGDAEAVARFRAEADLLGLLEGNVTPRLVEAGEDERPFSEWRTSSPILATGSSRRSP
jgi:hypothetical protein